MGNACKCSTNATEGALTKRQPETIYGKNPAKTADTIKNLIRPRSWKPVYNTSLSLAYSVLLPCISKRLVDKISTMKGAKKTDFPGCPLGKLEPFCASPKAFHIGLILHLPTSVQNAHRASDGLNSLARQKNPLAMDYRTALYLHAGHFINNDRI